MRTFSITGLHCAGCARNAERAVSAVPGSGEVYVNFATGKLTVSSGEKSNDANSRVRSGGGRSRCARPSF